jgi:hypothetical protein
MLLSLLYRTTIREAHSCVSYFSVVVVGLQPRLLVDCIQVTQANITSALASLAEHILGMSSFAHAQQSRLSPVVSDLDFFISTCLCIAQSRPFKAGVIMITECNVSSAAGQVRVRLCRFRIARGDIFSSQYLLLP